jgi:hypothetical protein
MRKLQSKNNLTLLILLLLISGCEKEPCLDIQELEKQSAKTKEWFVNDTIVNQEITDNHGISQTLIVSSEYTRFYENVVEDDCGNIYGSFNFSIQYKTSLSPLHFMIDIGGSGLSNDGFYLQMSITNTNSVGSKSATYDFVTESCRENNASMEIIKGNLIIDNIDSDVLKIDFNTTTASNDIKTVYYSKDYGIIKFIEENGNEFKIK